MATNTASSSKSPASNVPGHSAGPTSQIDEVLQQTEIGAWIAAHKTLTISLLALVVLGVFSYGGWRIYRSQLKTRSAEAVYAFETNYLQKLQAKEMGAQTYTERWQSFLGEWKGSKSIVPPLIKGVDELMTQGNLEGAKKLLETVNVETYGEMPSYFVNMRKAVIYEDLGELDKAISALEGMEKSGLDLIGSKVYFDLGRLYFEQGQREKAKLSFEHVTSHMAQDEFVKLSRIYLSRLEGKKLKVEAK